ncbi:MAG: GNAT family N-acetyltransferase [Dehalococcoidia bacterium]
MAAQLQTHPLTPDRWPGLERLFRPNGANSGCWCMWWFQTNREFAEGHGEPNRQAFRERVLAGPPPGILAYAGDEPVGWCALGPRQGYTRIHRSRTLKPVDDRPAWSIVCLFVKRDWRGRGVAAALVDAATAFAAAHGATLVEAYPVDVVDGARARSGDIYTGTLALFEQAGFDEVARRSPRRPIVRRQLP